MPETQGIPIPTPSPTPKPEKTQISIAENQEPEVTDAQFNHAVKLFADANRVFGEELDKRVTNPKAKQDYLNMISGMSKEDQVQLIFETADKLRIDNMKKSDPTFTPISAFVRGLDDTVTLGIAGKAIDSVMNIRERTRLLEKAYPNAFVGGEIGGFFVPLFGQVGTAVKGLEGSAKAARAASVIRSGADLFTAGSKARGLLGKYAGKILEKAGASEASKQVVKKALTSNTKVGRIVDAATGAVTFGTAQEAVAIGEETLLGENPEVVNRLGTRAYKDAAGAAMFGAGWEVMGPVASTVAGAAGWTFKKGASILGGKPIKYQIENIEEVRQALKAGPDAFIGAEAEKIGKILNKVDNELLAVQSQAKGEILSAVDAKKTELKFALREQTLDLQTKIAAGRSEATSAFRDSSDNFFEAVDNLRKAKVQDVATASKEVLDEFQKGFRRSGEIYRKGLDDALFKAEARLGGEVPRIDPTKALDTIEKHLKEMKVLTSDGRFLSEATAATQNAHLADLYERWSAMGGPTRIKGGSPGTLSVQDAIHLKRGVGEFASFAPGQKSMSEGVYGNIYHSLARDIEKAIPEIKEVNKAFAQNRSHLDLFRARVGASEKKIAAAIESQSERAGNLLTLEGFEALGKTSPEAALKVGKVGGLKEELAALSGIGKNEASARAFTLKAMIQGDSLYLARLDEVVKKNPSLRPKIEVLEKQANAVRSFQDAEAASRAISDPVFEGRLLQARPELAPVVEEARRIQSEIHGLPQKSQIQDVQARKLIEEQLPQTKQSYQRMQNAQEQQGRMREVFPEKATALESRLKNREFGSLETEKAIIKEAEGIAPELAESVKATESGRVAKQLQTGDIQASVLEQVSVIGPILFSMRKIATPAMARVIDTIGKTSEGTRKGMFAAVQANLTGTQAMPKETLDKLFKTIGAESALLIYHQSGGDKDIERAIDALGKDLGY